MTDNGRYEATASPTLSTPRTSEHWRTFNPGEGGEAVPVTNLQLDNMSTDTGGDRASPSSRADAETQSLRTMLRQAMDVHVESERRYARSEAALRKELEVLERQRERWFKSSAELRRHLDVLQQENSKLAQQLTNKGIFGRLRSNTKTASPGMNELDASMQQAQETAELLRSVVAPMEEEINVLRRQLRDAMPSTPGGVGMDSMLSPIVGSNMQRALDTEKSARMDLDMQIQVLNTQKSVLQTELEKIQLELDSERTAHTELKLTWQRANENYIDTAKEYERRIEVLENQLQRAVKLPTSNPFSGLVQSAPPPELTPSELESVAYLKSQLENEKVKYQQLNDIVESLRENHTRELKNARDTFQKQQALLESEIAAQRMEFVNYEEQITMLTQRLRTREMEAPKQQSCGLCENYEKQLVQMQSQKKETNEHAEQCLELARVKELTLETGLAAQAERHATQVRKLLDDQEDRLTREYAKRVETLSADYESIVAQLQQQVADCEAKHEALEKFFNNNRERIEAACAGVAGQQLTLQADLDACKKTLATKEEELKEAKEALVKAQNSEESVRSEFLSLQTDFNETSEELEAMSQALRDRREEFKNEKQQMSREIDRLLQANAALQMEIRQLSLCSDDLRKEQSASSASTANLCDDMEALRKEMEMVSMTRDNLQSLLQTSEAHLAATQAEVTDLKNQLEQAGKNHLEQVEALKTSEKLLKQKSREVLMDLQKELLSAREGLAESGEAIKTLTAQLATSQKVERELTGLVQTLQVELERARSQSYG